METIDLYDSYINNQLTEKERAEFDIKLKTDKEFASDFKVYLFTVNGICREAHQGNLDFCMAIKRLTKEQLCGIIGKKKNENQQTVAIVEHTQTEVAKQKVVRLKPWTWQVASTVAIVIIAFTAVFDIQKQSQNAMYDKIYAGAQFENIHTRGRGNLIDITKLDDSELEAKLPEMEKNYRDSNDIDELYLSGYPLAMAYIRLHKPQPALDVLTNMVSQLQHDEYYEPEVREMRLIIHMLK